MNAVSLRKKIGNDFFHIRAKSARIVFKIGAFLHRRLVNAWLKFKIARWRWRGMGVQWKLKKEKKSYSEFRY